MENEIEKTTGYKIAIGFKPFIDHRCNEHMEIIKDMANAINKHLVVPSRESKIIDRVKQTLSSLDYGTLTDFQAKCVLLLEQSIK